MSHPSTAHITNHSHLKDNLSRSIATKSCLTTVESRVLHKSLYTQSDLRSAHLIACAPAGGVMEGEQHRVSSGAAAHNNR